ncbi:hypothetical protein HPB52_021746 [Rhipicephalus sanguineus]|uniref:Mutator-like transposase domain-containing protein n=1 Tax=Rhipicephalus sanguineus TaxID=34632 RepID=A0A9D4T804_RHISA|nr:hypothetical protein HPB52_021746 [Rhipicephalus sanguineus]
MERKRRSRRSSSSQVEAEVKEEVAAVHEEDVTSSGPSFDDRPPPPPVTDGSSNEHQVVLDYVALSNFCAGCERGPKVDDASYEEWKANHECQKNTDKKAGEMEVEAGVVLFKRSLVKHSLQYTTVLSDGDSRTFLALKEAKVYGFIEVEKEDCINHVHKRMGTALRNVLSKHKGPGLEPLGRGRLTGDLVTKLSSYYG